MDRKCLRNICIKAWFTSDEEGLTLLELMIGMAILSIGLLAIASLQISTVISNKNGNLRTQALKLAQDRIEALATVNAATLDVSTPVTETGIDVHGSAGGVFTRTTVYAELASGSNARIATVTVSWQDMGRNRTVSMTSYVRGSGT